MKIVKCPTIIFVDIFIDFTNKSADLLFDLSSSCDALSICCR